MVYVVMVKILEVWSDVGIRTRCLTQLEQRWFRKWFGQLCCCKYCICTTNTITTLIRTRSEILQQHTQHMCARF